METSDIKENGFQLYSLFPKRGFWTGFSTVLSIFGEPRKFNYSKSSVDADRKAIGSDWHKIGKDFFKAMNSTATFS